MLGRSYWDLDIKVDIREYPGEPSSTTSMNRSIFLDFSGNGAGGFANNMQSTGQWAVAHQEFTAEVDTESLVKITIALNDDLTQWKNTKNVCNVLQESPRAQPHTENGK